MSKFHTPVMVDEVLAGLDVRKGKKYIDATIGGGGHALAILKRGGKLLGIDEDPEAVKYAANHITSEASDPGLNIKETDWKFVQGNFREIKRIATEQGFLNVSGILFDLGVSSYQLDTPERGFSYRFINEALDLRFDQTKGESAANLVNRLSEESLYEIFTRFSEEQLARPIARGIVRARHIGKIHTTADLTAIIDAAVGNRKDRNPTSSRIFQALRIAVNDELSALKEGLEGAGKLLEKDGRLVVLGFHSLEDRIVKQFMRQPQFTVLTKKPITAGRREVSQNSRAKSAKLRIAVYGH